MMQRDWSRIPTSTFWGALLRLPLRAIPKGTTVTVRSGINRGMKWIVGSSIHGCWLGTYELEKQSIIKRFVRPGMTVFDIGANAGFYTLAFSRLVGEEGHVWAFEPLAENASNILRHVNLNGLNNVTLLQAAVADRNGIVGFNIGESNSVGTISQTDASYKVPAVALDELIADGVPIPDLIKMDVEGAESLVLNGAKELLSRKKTTLFIALHSDDQQRKCAKFLRSSGYEIYLLDGQTAVGELTSDEIYATPSAA